MRAVLVVGGTVAVAMAVDGLAVMWAAATFLDTSCGEDIAWLVLCAAGGVASLAAFGGLVTLSAWHWGHQEPRWWAAGRGAMVTMTAASIVLATVAVVWLPDGSCP